MASKDVPWRTVIRSKETGRFTEKEISDAVKTVKNAGNGRSNAPSQSEIQGPSKTGSGVRGDGHPSRGQNGKR